MLRKVTNTQVRTIYHHDTLALCLINGANPHEHAVFDGRRYAYWAPNGYESGQNVQPVVVRHDVYGALGKASFSKFDFRTERVLVYGGGEVSKRLVC